MAEGSVLLEPERHPGDEVDPAALRFARGPKGLRLFVGQERCYLRVKVRLADPLGRPGRYISVVDGRDREICLLDTLDGLERESRRLVEEELDDFYAVATVRRVRALSLRHGPLYWRVDTDRGPREFVVRWHPDNVLHLAAGRLRLTDIDGNRFDLPPTAALDPASRKLVELLR